MRTIVYIILRFCLCTWKNPILYFLFGQHGGGGRLHNRNIRTGRRLRHRQGLHIGVHGLGHTLAGGDRVHNGARAVGDIAGRKDAGAGGVPVLIDGDDAAVSRRNTTCPDQADRDITSAPGVPAVQFGTGS